MSARMNHREPRVSTRSRSTRGTTGLAVIGAMLVILAACGAGDATKMGDPAPAASAPVSVSTALPLAEAESLWNTESGTSVAALVGRFPTVVIGVVEAVSFETVPLSPGDHSGDATVEGKPLPPPGRGTDLPYHTLQCSG